MKQVIVICGPPCSGKDTKANEFKKAGFHHVSVSDIVRRLTQTENRTHIKDLSKSIVEELVKIIDKYDKIVVNGPRQISIVGSLWNLSNTDITVGWIEVKREELEKRFLNRKASKDIGLTYQDVLNKDNELGLSKIESYIKTRSTRNLKFQIWNQ